MQMGKIEFSIDARKNELMFRTFHSSRAINDVIYVFISKLDGDDKVTAELYEAGKSVNAKRLLVKEGMTIPEFYALIQELEKDLKKHDSRLTMITNTTGAIAIMGGTFDNDVVDGAEVASRFFGGNTNSAPFSMGSSSSSKPRKSESPPSPPNVDSAATSETSSRLSRFME